jgi:copper chaperone
MTQLSLTAPDIECDGCANSIRKALGAALGIASVTVDVPTKAVAVEFDEVATSERNVRELLDDIGFPTQ